MKLLRLTAIKKIHTRCPVFQRPLNCRIVCGTPFPTNLWVPIFSKNLPGTGIMYYTFFPLRSPTFCHILMLPGGVRHPSFVFNRQRVRVPGRSPLHNYQTEGTGTWQVPHRYPTFASGHRLVPPPANIKQIARAAGKQHPLNMGTWLGFLFWPRP